RGANRGVHRGRIPGHTGGGFRRTGAPQWRGFFRFRAAVLFGVLVAREVIQPVNVRGDEHPVLRRDAPPAGEVVEPPGGDRLRAPPGPPPRTRPGRQAGRCGSPRPPGSRPRPGGGRSPPAASSSPASDRSPGTLSPSGGRTCTRRTAGVSGTGVRPSGAPRR